jgi:hypothetical protein
MKRFYLLSILLLVSYCSGAQHLNTINSGNFNTTLIKVNYLNGLMQLSNADPDRFSQWTDGSEQTFALLVEVNSFEYENFFSLVGIGKTDFSCSFESIYYDTPGNPISFNQSFHISSISTFAGASYRTMLDDSNFGISGTLVLRSVLPYKSSYSLTPNPLTGQNSEVASADLTGFKFFGFGQFSVEYFATDFLFITAGMTYTMGFSKLFTTYNGFPTSTSASLFSIGAGVIF